ncbi:sugar kinase [Solibacillus sp. FSL K6-4121]|uniref:sugar kinase n=1 Tax=Solibacillus sp. FSL K6-4121 TaxID=2921505 RepID=UPI0030F7F0E2
MNFLIVGEPLICFNPTENGALRFVSQFKKTIGGAELNVAIGLSRLEMDVTYISAVGNDALGDEIIHFIKSEGIDSKHVLRSNEHTTSLYIKEIMNESNINSYFYRKPSATEILNEKHFEEFKPSLFFMTGIFPALSCYHLDLTRNLMKSMKEKNVTIAFDVNVRRKLWSVEEMQSAFKMLFPYIDILFIGDDEAELLFGIANFEELVDFLTVFNISEIVMKQGKDGAIVKASNQIFSAKPKPLKTIDTVGAGDAFAAGYLYQWAQNSSIENRVHWGNKLAGYVISTLGDNEGLPTLIQLNRNTINR